MTRVRLVLVHGSRLAHSQWAPQVRLIAADPSCADWLEVVTPDLPAHGTAAADPFTLDRAVGTVAAAVESRSPTGEPVCVVIAGHSLGGYVAATYAETFPHRLDGLVLLGAAATPRGVGATIYRGVARLTDRLGPVRMTRVNDRVLGRLYPPDLVAEVTAGGYWFGPTRSAWAEIMARCGPDQLRQVTAPVLVAGGAYDQLMLNARRYARAAPDGRVAVIPRAGHLAGFDQPAAVTRLLVDFARAVRHRRDGTLGPS